MATVRLSDVIIPEVYQSYRVENIIYETAYWQSGIVVPNELMSASLSQPDVTGVVPYWKDLDFSGEPDYSSDDPTVHATPDKVGTGQFRYRKAWVNKSFQTADLVAELLRENPMQHIRNRFGTYWARQLQKRLIAMSLGIYNDNIDSGASYVNDMINDISIQDGNNATGANKFSRKAFTAAAYTLGDQVESLKAIAVHSIVHKTMVDNDDIDYIRDSQGNLTIPTFLGRRVIVDDSLPIIAGTTSGYRYVSILFGGGIFGFGESTPAVPMAITRDELAGNGAGIETIVERRNWAMHPLGYDWTEASVAGQSPTLAELKDKVNWTRVAERKAIPLSFLITNG